MTLEVFIFKGTKNGCKKQNKHTSWVNCWNYSFEWRDAHLMNEKGN